MSTYIPSIPGIFLLKYNKNSGILQKGLKVVNTFYIVI